MISIIIPVAEPLYLIEDCLNSIKNYTTYQDYEIILIDNTLTNGVQRVLNKIGPFPKPIIPFVAPENLFHVKSMRKGLELSHGDFILMLNDDTEVPRDQGHWLNRLLEMFSLYPNCGMATLTLLHRCHTIYWIGSGNNHHTDMHQTYNFVKQPPLEVLWSNMACALTKRSTLEAVPFRHPDETESAKLHYGMDRIWSNMIREKLGLKHIVCRDAWIYHYNERCVAQFQRKH